MDFYEGQQKEHKRIMYRLKKNEPLIGEILEIALKSIEICINRNGGIHSENSFLNTISAKMTKGQSLSEYEIHVMNDLISNMDYEEKRKERKSRGARYGHITRRLSRNEPLTGKTLELALELVNVYGDDEQSRFVRNIGVKMQAGQPLDQYEYHIVVDVLMVHEKFGI